MTPEEFEKPTELSRFMESLREGNGGFEPHVLYTPEGDCMEFITSPDDYYAERVDAAMTVYLRQSDGQLIGGQIKGAKKLMLDIISRYPGFSNEIRGGNRVQLERLITAELWTVPMGEPDRQRAYRRIRDLAEDSKLVAEFDEPAMA